MDKMTPKTSTQQLVDLHRHSSASDGAGGNPADIAAFCRSRGYAAFSLTEHETFNSLDAAKKAARETGIEFVPGIELGVDLSDPAFTYKSADIVGYFYELTPELRQIGLENENRYYKWIQTALERLHEKGIVHVTEEELRETIRTSYGEDDVWKQPYNLGPVRRVLVQKEAFDPKCGKTIREFLFDQCPKSEMEPRVDLISKKRFEVIRD